MNAVIPTIVEQQADTSQFGEIQAAWQITPEALIILGWRQERSSVDGMVAHQRPDAPKGRFHSVSWPFASGSGDAHYFAAALQLPIGCGVRAGETLLLTGKGETSSVLARLPPRFLDTLAFGAELARLAAAHAIAVTRFLTQTFTPAATRGNTDIRALLHAFLERASSPDGCIELIGGVENHCVILQGWGAALGPECDIIVVGAEIERHAPKMAVYSRADLRGTACGQMVVLPATVASGIAQIDAIVLLDRRGLRWRPVISERRLLSGLETVAHLKETLPRLKCDAATGSVLQASLRPRFDGRFTLYDGGHPVRLAVDLAAAGQQTGIYLTGWLYDPTAVVTEIHLRGPQGVPALISKNWTRIVREDVTDAFSNDPALPRGEHNQHRHGFVIHVAGIVSPPSFNGFYLDVSFKDGQCGFVPVTINSAADPMMQTRLMGSVDLHKASGLQIVEQHLAPFFFRLGDVRNELDVGVVVPVPQDWCNPIIVPLPDPFLPKALLSQFLHDPLLPSEGVVFVCSNNWTATAIDALCALSTFYGIPAAVLTVNGPAVPVAALSAVIEVAQPERLLILASGTVGRSIGWRQALHRVLDEVDEMICVSPTVIYEDESIRFGGTDGVEQLDTSPYVRIQRRWAGFPVGSIDETISKSTFTVSPACCLMPRKAVGGYSMPMSMTASLAMQEISLSLMLKKNGIASIWTPTAQVYAAEATSASMNENTTRVSQLVNGWCLRAHLATEE